MGNKILGREFFAFCNQILLAFAKRNATSDSLARQEQQRQQRECEKDEQHDIKALFPHPRAMLRASLTQLHSNQMARSWQETDPCGHANNNQFEPIAFMS
jgi:hypothetical protein